MMLFVVSFAGFAFAMALMALGIVLGRAPLTGSCGRGANCGCRRRG